MNLVRSICAKWPWLSSSWLSPMVIRNCGVGAPGDADAEMSEFWKDDTMVECSLYNLWRKDCCGPGPGFVLVLVLGFPSP